jgi:uncharacterized delta-60 repeat protein
VLSQPDGKIVVSGRFTRWNNIPRPGLVRLLSDGTLDPGFYPNVGVVNGLQCHTLDAEGRLYITAAFPIYDEQFLERHAVGRLHYEGSLDQSFGGGLVDVEESIAMPNTVALQPDGKVLVGGYPYRNPSENPSVARFQTNGSVDASFQPAPVYVGDDYGVLEFGIQSDGRIVLGGELVPVRYLPNGELDSTFKTELVWGTLHRLVVLPDDRLLVSGWFTTDDITWLYVARLLPNGRLDPSFNAPPGYVYAIAAQSDGRVLVAYEKELIRLNADGSIDSSFPAVKPNALIRKIALESDGGILIAGDFTSVNGIPCQGLARLNNVVFPLLRPLPVASGQPLTVSLAGTPGLYSIEISTDLQNWTVAGTVTNGPSRHCEFVPQPGSEPYRFYRARKEQ